VKDARCFGFKFNAHINIISYYERFYIPFSEMNSSHLSSLGPAMIDDVSLYAVVSSLFARTDMMRQELISLQNYLVSRIIPVTFRFTACLNVYTTN
jgi:ABC-type enterochelin transport system permease subunit